MALEMRDDDVLVLSTSAGGGGAWLCSLARAMLHADAKGNMDGDHKVSSDRYRHIGIADGECLKHSQPTEDNNALVGSVHCRRPKSIVQTVCGRPPTHQ